MYVYIYIYTYYYNDNNKGLDAERAERAAGERPELPAAHEEEAADADDLGDSKKTGRGYCLDIPRFEESLHD